MGLKTRLWPVALLIVVGCRRRIEGPEIGFTSGVGPPNAATLATEILARDSDPMIRRVRLLPHPLDARGGALEGEVERALALVADPSVVAVVGPGGSREALQVAPIYREHEVPDLVPTATSRRLRDVGDWTFTLAPNDSLQGEFLGAYAGDRLHARRVLLFYIPDEYGLGLAEGVAAALRERQVELLDQIPVDGDPGCRPGDTYELAVDAALGKAQPDAVILATRTDATTCLARAVHDRLPSMRFLVGDGTLADSALARRVGAAAESMYVVAFWHPDAGSAPSREFAEAFQRVVGRPARHDDAMFYDAVMLLVAGIREVGPDRAALRDYLADLGHGRPPYEGVTGPIAFGAAARRPLLMVRPIPGKVVLARGP